jgi:hypothetical protein
MLGRPVAVIGTTGAEYATVPGAKSSVGPIGPQPRRTGAIGSPRAATPPLLHSITGREDAEALTSKRLLPQRPRPFNLCLHFDRGPCRPMIASAKLRPDVAEIAYRTMLEATGRRAIIHPTAMNPIPPISRNSQS